MQKMRDTYVTIHDCENAVHEAFKNHSSDVRTLTNVLGALQIEFGSHAVMAAMTNCAKIAYLRLYGPGGR